MHEVKARGLLSAKNGMNIYRGCSHGCIEIIHDYRFRLAIQTKSARILRNVDILKKTNDKTKCVVEMTPTTYDEDLCKIIEPNLSTTKNLDKHFPGMKARYIGGYAIHLR